MRLAPIGLASVETTVVAFAANVDRVIMIICVAISIFGDDLANASRTKR